MTALQDTTELTRSLIGEYAQHDLTLLDSDHPTLDGPLSVVRFRSLDGDGSFPLTVAVAASAGLELLDLVIAATQRADSGLVPEAPTSIASLAELDELGGVTAGSSSLLFGGTPIGVVIRQNDRRNGSDHSQNSPSGFAPQTGPTGGAPSGAGMPLGRDLTMLRDVVLDVTVELGRDSLTLAQMLNLTIGSVVELDRAAGSPVDIRVNGILFGRGEVVVVDDEYAVRITEILASSGS